MVHYNLKGRITIPTSALTVTTNHIEVTTDGAFISQLYDLYDKENTEELFSERCSTHYINGVQYLINYDFAGDKTSNKFNKYASALVNNCILFYGKVHFAVTSGLLTDGEYLHEIAIKHLIRTCDLYGDSDDEDFDDSEAEEDESVSDSESEESDGMVTDDDSFVVNGLELDFEEDEEYDF